jgi:hypothetical protein
MTENFHHFRVVALDLRSRKLGFAVLEGSRKLLDWGIKGCRTHRDLARVAQKRIAPVLTLFAPSVVILEAGSSRKAEEPRREVISKAIQAEVLRRSIDLVFVRKDEIRGALGKGEPITKQKIASHNLRFLPFVLTVGLTTPRFLPCNAIIAWSRRALSASNSLMIASVSMPLLDG